MPYLQTIHSKSAPRIGCTVLQLGDNGMVHVLLLFTQEMSTHSVERVAAELVVTLNDLENVHLQSSINVDSLGVALTESL